MNVSNTRNNPLSAGLKILLIFHGLATTAAGIVLIVSPELIPAAVDIRVDPGAYLLCYLLASTELSIGFISFAAFYLKDPKSIKLICIMFIILHASTACLELYALSNGVSSKIWSNIVLRIVMILLFAWLGVYKNLKKIN
jgi:hypothetical protein